MKKHLKVMLVAGARPNFMKIAPLVRAINEQNESLRWGKVHINYFLVHTGQHYDVKMSETFFRELELPNPDINLEVGSASHAGQAAEIMKRFEPVLMKEQPDIVVVVGDVNSTMACALVASKIDYSNNSLTHSLNNQRVKRPFIAHVEAGLRSFDRTMPEEINRLVTDAVSDLLFTPSEDADENLLREGVPKEKIKRVGNIMIDTLVEHLEKARQSKSYDRFELKPKHYAFVTLHRPSNVDNKVSLSIIMECLIRLSQNLRVIFPLHPRTRKSLMQFGLWEASSKFPKLILCEPLGYHETMGLVDKAQFVLTDSGGLQEETTFLKVPCLTLRPNTERPITVTEGTNKLTSLAMFEKDIEFIIHNGCKKGKIPELWDGFAADRIVNILTNI